MIPDIGLWHYKARFYSPTLGRFMQTDPIGYGDGPNWYNYVGGDPVNRRDPFGLNQDTIHDTGEVQNAVDDGTIVVKGRRLPKDDAAPDITLPPSLPTGSSSGDVPRLSSVEESPFSPPDECSDDPEKCTHALTISSKCKFSVPVVNLSFDTRAFVVFGVGFSGGVCLNLNSGEIDSFVSARAGYGAGLSVGAGLTATNAPVSSDLVSGRNFSLSSGAAGFGVFAPSSPRHAGSATLTAAVGPRLGFELSNVQIFTKTRRVGAKSEQICR